MEENLRKILCGLWLAGIKDKVIEIKKVIGTVAYIIHLRQAGPDMTKERIRFDQHPPALETVSEEYDPEFNLEEINQEQTLEEILKPVLEQEANTQPNPWEYYKENGEWNSLD